LEVHRAKLLTAHRARPHSARDLRDFRRLREGENSARAMRRGVTFEFPYDKGSFKDRYTRQARRALCSTVVAHLSKDGLMFVHPTQCRSLTPREAARVQTFPDWFTFPVARTHQFRLIGNAVPPIVGEAVGIAVRATLRRATIAKRRDAAADGRVPLAAKAEDVLSTVVNASPRSLRSTPAKELLRMWRTVLAMFHDLHPSNASGHTSSETGSRKELIVSHGNGAFRHRFGRSGWPVALEEIGREMNRRVRRAEIDRSSYFLTYVKPPEMAVDQRQGALCPKATRRMYA
jgi:DNA (cytosine-5)-methyltransferase 1